MKSFTKLYCLFLLLIFSFMNGVAQHTYTLAGTILDKQKKEGVSFAHVYLNGTSFGTQADDKGNFTLKNVLAGNYQFLISMVGFQALSVPISVMQDIKNLHFDMLENITDLVEIKVQGQRDRVWERQIRQFENEFLGRDIDRDLVKILNREAIDFEFDPSTKTLKASSKEPLLIENKELGYLYHGFLVGFEKAPRQLNFKSSGYFEALNPISNKEKAKWEKNRKYAFQGSIRHFLLALMNQSLTDEGFYVTYYKENRLSNPPPFKMEEVLFTTNKPNIFAIDLKGIINVEFDSPRQFSKLKPMAKTILVESNGTLLDPYSIEVFGKMSESRMGNELPLDYVYELKK
ncbi:carboxypeptidase-like regulatory domain-containing protein [Aquirufa aurantiipilula]|uniref:carboxypeptidase-like regulatory domain-containing protein n=1 Tax=Aquirufa aurantiipilula TaxID=2696561 RepID=UPI001CAA5B9C|nr:carboxypeptidase-like regulatory domain-containing protein [Aquirufa aurantiipilula]MBZ1325691.1 carboxypeptidase-like regulatory domain-containing protein [Aquirufa aurantiipilula]